MNISSKYAFMKGKQRGAAAIEFALVFVLFISVLFAVVSYSLPMLILQSLNNAAAEGVRQAVGGALSPGQSGFAAQAQSQARAAVEQQLMWMPAALSVPSDAIQVNWDAPNQTLEVRIVYPPDRLANVLPHVPLFPNIQNLPPVVASIKLY